MADNTSSLPEVLAKRCVQIMLKTAIVESGQILAAVPDKSKEDALVRAFLLEVFKKDKNAREEIAELFQEHGVLHLLSEEEQFAITVTVERLNEAISLLRSHRLSDFILRCALISTMRMR